MRAQVDFVGRHGRRVRSSLAAAGAGTLLVLTSHPAHAASSAAHAAASPACAAAVPTCAAAGSPASATGALGLLLASQPRTLSLGTPVGIVNVRIGLDSRSSCGCGSPLTAHITRRVAGSRTHSNPSSLNGSLPDRAPAVPVPSGGAVSSCGCGTGGAAAVAVQVDVTIVLGAGTTSCGCATTVPTTKHHHKPTSHGGGTTPPGGGTTPPGGGTTPPTTSHGGGGESTPPATNHGGGTTPTAVVTNVESSPAASTGNGGGEGLAETGGPLLPGLAGLLLLGIGGLLEWRRRATQ
jgi:hypothetical protein